MALPKGVKSPVDYTKLYMSNELEGDELSEAVPAFVKGALKLASMAKGKFSKIPKFASIAGKKFSKTSTWF